MSHRTTHRLITVLVLLSLLLQLPAPLALANSNAKLESGKAVIKPLDVLAAAAADSSQVQRPSSLPSGATRSAVAVSNRFLAADQRSTLVAPRPAVPSRQQVLASVAGSEAFAHPHKSPIVVRHRRGSFSQRDGVCT